MKYFILLLLIPFAGCQVKSDFVKSFDHVMDQKELKVEELAEFDKEELRILRNSVFAQHGYPFQSEELQYYFYAEGAKPAGYSFHQDENYSKDKLTEIDKKNIDLIRSLEEGNISLVKEEKEKSTETTQRVTYKSNYSAKQIYAILNEDAIAYDRELSSRYDTELKVKAYKETSEYRKKLDEIKALKQEITSTRQFLEVTDHIKLNDYHVGAKAFSFDHPIPPYSLDRHSEVLNFAGIPESTLNQVNGIYTEENFVIPCPEDKALIIENNRDKIRLILSFDICDKGHVMYPIASSLRIEFSYPLIKVENIRYHIILDNEILFET